MHPTFDPTFHATLLAKSMIAIHLRSDKFKVIENTCKAS